MTGKEYNRHPRSHHVSPLGSVVLSAKRFRAPLTQTHTRILASRPLGDSRIAGGADCPDGSAGLFRDLPRECAIRTRSDGHAFFAHFHRRK